MPPKITTKLSKNKTRSDDYSLRHHSDANQLGSHFRKHVPCLFASYVFATLLSSIYGQPTHPVNPIRLPVFLVACRSGPISILPLAPPWASPPDLIFLGACHFCLPPFRTAHFHLIHRRTGRQGGTSTHFCPPVVQVIRPPDWSIKTIPGPLSLKYRPNRSESPVRAVPKARNLCSHATRRGMLFAGKKCAELCHLASLSS